MLKTPEEITPQWLTEILRGADVLPRGAVEALEVGAERPFGALVAALRATYSAEAPAEAPKRLFIKLTSPDNPGRDREVSFYRALAPGLPSPPVVRCFHAEYEAEARTALEDVAYFITPFTYAERRARLEQPLVDHYHARLCAAGVAGYAWQQCWQDYRLCALKNLFYPLRIWLQGGWGPARWSHLEKVLVAAEDLRGAAERRPDAAHWQRGKKVKAVQLTAGVI